MTVRVTRTYDVDANIEAVWEQLADEENRATALDIVESYEKTNGETIWYIRLPIPLIDRTVAVTTKDVNRDPPDYVKFVGKSKVLNVTGEHALIDMNGRCRIRNTFVVDGKLPGVERFFKRNIDDQIENIMHSVSDTVTPVEE